MLQNVRQFLVRIGMDKIEGRLRTIVSSNAVHLRNIGASGRAVWRDKAKHHGLLVTHCEGSVIPAIRRGKNEGRAFATGTESEGEQGGEQTGQMLHKSEATVTTKAARRSAVKAGRPAEPAPVPGRDGRPLQAPPRGRGHSTRPTASWPPSAARVWPG